LPQPEPHTDRRRDRELLDSIDYAKPAEAVARSSINDEDWYITRVETATEITRQTQNPGGLQYFEQAEVDGAIFVYHTWPTGAPDRINVV
jgi:hypothetical protein